MAFMIVGFYYLSTTHVSMCVCGCVGVIRLAVNRVYYIKYVHCSIVADIVFDFRSHPSHTSQPSLLLINPQIKQNGNVCKL